MTDATQTPSKAQMGKSKKRGLKKGKLIRINRYMAWITVPLLILSTFVFFSPSLRISLPDWMQLFSPVFQLFFVVHTLISIYVFRFPRLSASPKSIEIYSGYGILLTVILNFSFYGHEPYATIVFWANWAFIAVHIVLGMRFALRRLKRGQQKAQAKRR